MELMLLCAHHLTLILNHEPSIMFLARARSDTGEQCQLSIAMSTAFPVEHEHIHGRCRYIDGRVWPKEDELEVRLMLDLIRHVTGQAIFVLPSPVTVHTHPNV